MGQSGVLSPNRAWHPVAVTRKQKGAVGGVAGALGALTGAGAALFGYTLVEPHLPRLQIKEIRLGYLRMPVEILHISDAHLSTGQRTRKAFLGSLMDRLERTPELVLSTGDMIDTNSGIEPLLEALAPLEAAWGKFYVNGSHDYFQARFMTYKKYFGVVERSAMVPSDYGRLKTGLDRLAWVSLTNREEVLETPIGTVRLSGVDDPYLNRHRTEHLKTERSDALRIGLMHAPDVVAEFALAGFDLMVAGHTHGGQVRFPLIGAVVTNSSLPNELAMGLHRVGSSWLHVSPGLGHGMFSPIRFLTRPEATLLKLVPGS